MTICQMVGSDTDSCVVHDVLFGQVYPLIPLPDSRVSVYTPSLTLFYGTLSVYTPSLTLFNGTLSVADDSTNIYTLDMGV